MIGEGNASAFFECDGRKSSFIQNIKSLHTIPKLTSAK
jgi:hypothetical protein